MLINRSSKSLLDRSLQVLVVGAVSLGCTTVALAADTPAPAPAAPAASAAAEPIAPAAQAQPAQVAPASSATPAKAAATDGQAHPTAVKPGVNVYNGTNASTLDFVNRNPTLKKPGGPDEPWKIDVFEEHNPSYFVNVKYPQFDPIKGSDPSKLNAEIKSYVRAQIDALRPSMPTKMKQTEGPAPRSYINGECRVSLYNQHLCSLTVDLTSYAYQSAHPFEALTTFNYRLDTNHQFALKDVFRNDFQYIPAVSKMCIASLSQGLDDEGIDWVRRGAAPQDKNFQKFQLTGKSLEIVFDPYTIDNGADGFRSVGINWNRLRGNVSNEEPFHKLVKQ